MARAIAHPEIAAMHRDRVAQAVSGDLELAEDVLRIPASHYTCPDRFALEVARIFRRLPLMLAPSAELANAHDFKTLYAAGVPVLLTRGADGVVRGFVNSCSHRGSQVALDDTGNARRFTCPYHGWTFGQDGSLLAIADARDFGAVDKSCLGLKALPVAERAGLIFGILDPASTLDIDAFLSGYDALLGLFGFEGWHLFSSRQLTGPNWKIAYDGYLDFYHLPVLHKDTFGADFGNRAFFRRCGPHQRVIPPDRDARALAGVPEATVPDPVALAGVWTIFPHVSIAGFDGGGRGVMISQLLPGATVDTSITRQIYLMEHPPTPEQDAAAHAQFAFLETVVAQEDYETGIRQQRALACGAVQNVLFGRNEGGAQAFHGWVDRILATADADLPGLFQPQAQMAAE